MCRTDDDEFDVADLDNDEPDPDIHGASHVHNAPLLQTQTQETPYFITLIQSDFCASRLTRTPDTLTYSENHVWARGRRHKRSREDGPKM
jgi:hypothetical protein